MTGPVKELPAVVADRKNETIQIFISKTTASSYRYTIMG
jgi:hypothetical protein